MNRIVKFGLGAALLVTPGAFFRAPALAQGSPVLERPAADSGRSPAAREAPETLVAVASGDAAVKPLTEGPLHEAFLSPAKDREPVRVAKAPPPPIVERPGVDPPDPRAQWIEGYWEWDDARRDFIWVTGTWRVPPPGRFWVNGYWKRDDQGWFRVSGFWSDRKTDRIDFRKNGPPAEHPVDEPGESPGADYFYVPGQYFPDANGVLWKAGFWAKIQPGWAWVPAQWVKQPEGWAFQEGYWDRVLEDRGTLFAPAQVPEQARDGNTVYQPYSQVSPQTYGLLYGAFGRPNAYYDGYPGCYYDPNGQYYGYAQYGYLGNYYGYLDYPYSGGLGYPYMTSGYGAYPYYGGYGFAGYGGIGGYGIGLGLGGLFSGLYGFGLPNYAGFYLGYPYNFYSPWGGGYAGFGGYGGFGFGNPFFGFGNPLFGGFGIPFYGLGFGFPFFGFGGGFGFGFPFFGFGGFPGFGGGFFGNRFPFFPGGNRFVNNGIINRTTNITNINNRTININNGLGLNRGLGLNGMNRGNGVTPPASSHPYANPFLHQGANHLAGNQAGLGRGSGNTGTGAGAGSLARHAVGGPAGSNWGPSFNGVRNATLQHSAARPTFASHTNAGLGAAGVNHAGAVGGLNHAGALGNAAASGAAVHRGGIGAPNAAGGLGAQNMGSAVPHAAGAANGSHLYTGPSIGHANALAPTHNLGGVNGFNPAAHAGGNLGALGAGRAGGLPAGGIGGFSPSHLGGYAAAPHMGGLGAAPHMGGFAAPHMGGFAAPHMGGFSAPHMGGFGGGMGHVGGMGGMGHMGGGGHGGGGHR
jgi:hypothetical protein